MIAFYGCWSGNDKAWLEDMLAKMPNVYRIKGTTRQVRWKLVSGSEPEINFDVIVEREKKLPPGPLRE